MSAPFSSGTLLILNDNSDNLGGNLAAAGIDPVGQAFIGLTLLPASEQGDILPSGVMIIPSENTDANFVTDWVVYDADFAILATLPTQATQGSLSPVRGNRVDTFYVPQVDRTLITISDAGVIGGTTWTLPANSDDISAGCPSLDGTIYYYASHFENPAAVHRYDLIGDAPLTDLFAEVAPSSIRVKNDILVLDSGDILVMMRTDEVVLGSHEVRRYQPDGTLVATYPCPVVHPSTPERISLALDDPDSFWIYAAKSGSATFTNVLVADGSTVSEFSVGLGDGTDGPTSSCPLLLMMGTIAPLVVRCPGDQVGISSTGGDIPMTWPAPTFTGGFPPCVITAVPPAGSLFPVGTTPVIVTAVDDDDNTDTCSFNVIVGQPTGVPMRKLRRSTTFSTDKLWNFFERFQLDFQAGGPRAVNNVPIDICLRYSDDNGNTWSDELWQTVDNTGNYTAIAQWFQLGRGRDRVWEVSSTSEAMTVWLAAYVDYTQGTHG